MKTLLPCELSPQSPSLPFIRQFYVKQELCGLRRMETDQPQNAPLNVAQTEDGAVVAVSVLRQAHGSSSDLNPKYEWQCLQVTAPSNLLSTRLTLGAPRGRSLQNLLPIDQLIGCGDYLWGGFQNS